MNSRFFIVVLDGVGIGALPDAHFYGDEGANTLVNISKEVGGLSLPNLGRLGIGNLAQIAGTPSMSPSGACGSMAMASPGKDSTTGHWEISGVILDKPFKVYPNGFPDHVIKAFEDAIGRKTLWNKPASGTEIIEKLGALHLETGFPIVYTSADSVFQVACHQDPVPLELLYSWCELARDILMGEDMVARVIARPFTGKPGEFTRTGGRKDFSIPPVEETLLDYAHRSGVFVTAVGKIHDIFAGRGIDRAIATSSNEEGMQILVSIAQEPCLSSKELIFANFVDFDMLYGHRNDAKGYARALEEFDLALSRLMDKLRSTDVLAITADHGCDPTTPGTDHTREYVPLLLTGKLVKKGVLLGTRSTFADLGATAGRYLEVNYAGKGTDFSRAVFRAPH